MKVISEDILVSSLEKIKKALNRISKRETEKIVFMSINGLFKYMTDMGYADSAGGKDIKELFETIEPYIPVSLTEENLAAALKAVLAVNSEEECKIDESFVNCAKVRFLNRLSTANTKKEWEETVSVCKMIRDYMEESGTQ